MDSQAVMLEAGTMPRRACLGCLGVGRPPIDQATITWPSLAPEVRGAPGVEGAEAMEGAAVASQRRPPRHNHSRTRNQHTKETIATIHDLTPCRMGIILLEAPHTRQPPLRFPTTPTPRRRENAKRSWLVVTVATTRRERRAPRPGGTPPTVEEVGAPMGAT